MRASLAPSPASTFPPAAIMASPLGDIFKPPFVSTLTLGSDLTLHNMPGPSTSAVPPPPHPQSSSVEVDAKPESNILPQSTPESTIAAATLEFKEKMEDLHKVVADIFNSVKDESTSPNIPQLKSTLDEKPNTQRDSVQSASVPRTFVHRLSGHSQQANAWSVYCDNCEKNMLNEHYHCNICNAGDYDICPECRDSGVHCKGEGHWLIKRVFNPDGTIVTSTTEKVGPKSAPEGAKEVKDMPGAFTEEKKDVLQPTRTCNCCVKVFPEFAFVTCNNCEDYDLCVPCLEEGKHGHHPAHKFEPATHVTNLSERTKKLCMPGRNAVHSATCDNCDCVSELFRHTNSANQYRQSSVFVTSVKSAQIGIIARTVSVWHQLNMGAIVSHPSTIPSPSIQSATLALLLITVFTAMVLFAPILVATFVESATSALSAQMLTSVPTVKHHQH